MRTAVLLLVTALSACTLNYSDEEWAATFSGKEFGHVFYHHEDQQISTRGVSLPGNSPSIISDFGAKHGVKGGFPQPAIMAVSAMSICRSIRDGL